MERTCPDCDTVAGSSDEYVRRGKKGIFRVWECCNPKCGLQFILVKGVVKKIRYVPWDDLQKEITSLYILRRKGHAGYRRVQGFVVRATSPEEARSLVLAYLSGYAKNHGEDRIWMYKKYSTCEKLSHYGPSEIILRDFRNG